MSIIVGRVGLGVDLESNPFDRQLKTGRLREILH